MSKAEDKKIDRATIKLFWEGNFQQKWSLALCYATRIPGFAIQNIIIPLFVALAIESIFTENFDEVGGYALIILGLTILFGVLAAIGAWAISHNATRGAIFVERKVFANYLNKDYEFYNSTYFGALGAQAIKLRSAHHEYGRLVTLDIPNQATTIIAGLAVIIIAEPLLAIVTLVAMAFVLSYTILSSRWRLRFRRALSKEDSILAGKIGDALTHSFAVKSFAREKFEADRLKENQTRWGRAQFKSWVSSIPADFGTNLLAAVTIAVLLILTANLYEDGSISIAMVALVQLYVLKMIVATHDIAATIKAHENVMGSSHQAVKTMLIEPTINDINKPKDFPAKQKIKEISFDNVSYTYGESKNKPAVADFSLNLKTGQKIGLVGYSGSGKTTLTKTLLRFIEVTKGSIEIGGINLKNLRQRDIRNHIAYVPQEPILFHRSIYDNIAYGNPKASKKEVEKAAKLANATEFIKEMPEGMDTFVGERGVKLSGGQRQRVAIARAILKDAPVLVLDEATSALDSKSEKLIQEALWNLMKNRTTLVIAHRLSTIQHLDEIVVMDKGKIVQSGPHKQLLKDKKGIYADLWNHQSGGYIGADTN